MNYKYQSNKYGFLIVFLGLILCFAFWWRGEEERKDLEVNGLLTVGKFVEVEHRPKNNMYHFSYYINNTKHRAAIQNVPDGFYHDLGKFYRIKYAIENPEMIMVYFDNEVTDTVQLFEAGFAKEELEAK